MHYEIKHYLFDEHFFEQYLTFSQFNLHFFRQIKDLLQTEQIFEGRFSFFTRLYFV